MNNYKRLIQDKYLTFFEQKDATYMYEDGIHQARYFGVAFEFVCEISSSDLHVDYNDLYDNVFKDEKWLYVDALEGLTDDFIENLTAIQVVTILAAIRHKELFCTGFIKLCGQTGTIYRLLKHLKNVLEGEG